MPSLFHILRAAKPLMEQGRLGRAKGAGRHPVAVAKRFIAQKRTTANYFIGFYQLKRIGVARVGAVRVAAPLPHVAAHVA